MNHRPYKARSLKSAERTVRELRKQVAGLNELLQRIDGHSTRCEADLAEQKRVNVTLSEKLRECAEKLGRASEKRPDALVPAEGVTP